MCGVVGALVLSSSSFRVSEPYVMRMRDSLAHRGPDGAGVWIDSQGRIGLGHRRLSIIDLSEAARQPMANEDETLWVAFNGEIYNHAAIRRELEALGGHRWRTDHSDTEVILHAFEEWGIDCVQKFRGMFAIALWDRGSQTLLLARDRLGIKPLYWAEHDEMVWFASELKALEPRLPWGCDRLDQVLPLAVGPVLNDATWPWLAPEVAAIVLQDAVAGCLNLLPAPEGLDLNAAVTGLLARGGPGEAAALNLLRWTQAEWLCAQGRGELLDACVAPALQASGTPGDAALPGRVALHAAFQALLAAQAGQWDACIVGTEQALADLRKLTGRRTRLLPQQAGTAYVLALLARGTAADLATALKFCLGEGGKREPVLDSPYGFIALAIQMRQGEARRELGSFRPYTLGGRVQVSPLDLWRWLMRAWLKEGALPETLLPAEMEAAELLRQRLRAAGQQAAVAQLDGALAVLQGERPPAGFFITGPREQWQQALEALQGIVAPAPAEPAAATETRLRWVLELDARGAVLDLLALEQKQGARGWGKLKEVPLSRLQRGAEALPPADAAVARTLQQERYGRDVRFDLPAAVAALVGHPSVALSEDPEQPIELQEASAELEVLREGERLRVRLWPPMQVAADEAQARWGGSAAE